ncbi:hypothetical protein ACOMHN_004664 [Nucella lapillus]
MFSFNTLYKTLTTLTTLSSILGTPFYPPCRRIDAAVRWSSSNVTYFFSADEFIMHNDAFNAEEEVVNVQQLAQRFPTHVEAAVTWFARRSRSSKSLYFKGCYYYKLSEASGLLHRRRRLSRLHLPCDLDAAVNTDDHTILVFKGCQYWTITRSRRRAVLSGVTSDLGLPCDVDAALTWHNGTSYVIKGDVIWALSSSNMTAEYQSSVEEWNLCSWRICREEDEHAGNDSHLVSEDGGFACNGDTRFCALRFDQLTMPGSHNAGAGFDGGFGFFSCWVRNQYLSVLEQLRFGVRFLDVDSSWEHCGMLGTFHNFVCGGSVCKMIKQVKQFLRENRHEVVGINFNHEMVNLPRVIPALVRQITSQLGHYVSSAYRDVGRWPLLSDAVRTDQRLFVIMDSRVAVTLPHSDYLRHKWIHSESLLKSTWRGDVGVDHDCQQVVESSRQQCQAQQHAALLEVSIFGYSTGCVTSIADLCLPLVHRITKDCQQDRHARGKAPNVLLVDFPERVSHAALSVTSAAFLQNVRNAHRLASGGCRVGVEAAVWLEEEGEEEGGEEEEEEEGEEEGGVERIVFYPSGGGDGSGGDGGGGGSLRSASAGPLVYNWQLQVQDREESVEYAERFLPPTADAAFRHNGDVCFVSGCDLTCFRRVTSLEVYMTSTANITTWGLPCHVDAALTMTEQELTIFFKGCHYWSRHSSGEVTGPDSVTDFGVPCDLSAALQAPDGAVYFFKGDNYWRHNGGDLGLSPPADILDWSADFVHC